ncbi:MAG: PcfJ domain-containing protein [Rhizobiaceae bacterium]|nr:PcfJ domain-containing protein [Rhizobiaceae bacterium]
MARSTIQRRHEAERQRNAAYDATLRRVFAAARPAPDFETALNEARQGFGHLAVRDVFDWRPKLKTRDAGKLRLAAARHLYARYPVSTTLEKIWLSADGLDRDEIALRKRWYIAAARGDSLVKGEAGQMLSRREAHQFLNPPGDLGFDEALWHAIARSYTTDAGNALRIARSKIARTPRRELGFWREVAQFFCANPTTTEEIDDLCDYLAAARGGNRRFSLKGRTLGSLRRQTHEWHRDVMMVARIELMRRRMQARADDQAAADARWAGSQLSDWSWQPSDKEAKARREDYVVTQLHGAADLVAESRAMHHCVSTYAAKCLAGSASIWSLRRRQPGKVDRLLTIELDRQHRAVQVRGFANRPAHPDERKVLERWAKARGVELV